MKNPLLPSLLFLAAALALALAPGPDNSVYLPVIIQQPQPPSSFLVEWGNNDRFPDHPGECYAWISQDATAYSYEQTGHLVVADCIEYPGACPAGMRTDVALYPDMVGANLVQWVGFFHVPMNASPYAVLEGEIGGEDIGGIPSRSTILFCVEGE